MCKVTTTLLLEDGTKKKRSFVLIHRSEVSEEYKMQQHWVPACPHQNARASRKKERKKERKKRIEKNESLGQIARQFARGSFSSCARGRIFFILTTYRKSQIPNTILRIKESENVRKQRHIYTKRPFCRGLSAMLSVYWIYKLFSLSVNSRLSYRVDPAQ